MGHPVPELPVIEPDSFYGVIMDVFFFDPPNCAGPFVGTTRCCITGESLTDYIDNETECTSSGAPCGDIGGLVQKLNTYFGPFGTQAACILELF